MGRVFADEVPPELSSIYVDVQIGQMLLKLSGFVSSLEEDCSSFAASITDRARMYFEGREMVYIWLGLHLPPLK